MIRCTAIGSTGIALVAVLSVMNLDERSLRPMQDRPRAKRAVGCLRPL